MPNTNFGKLKYSHSLIMQEIAKSLNLKAIAHITGGGLIGNLKRIIPENIKIHLLRNSFKLAIIKS